MAGPACGSPACSTADLGRRWRLWRLWRAPWATDARTAGLPAPVGQPQLEAVDLVAPHCLAEAAADLGQDAGVLVVRGGLDDRLGPAGGVVALEDAGPDEGGLGP